MRIRWASKAYSDLARLHDFLEPMSAEAAARATLRLTKAPEALLDMPRIGERLEGFGARDVRRLLIEAYEVQYEILDQEILILRIWHTREDR